MFDDGYNPFSFISSDVVVWNGIVTSFGSIQHFAHEGDSLRIANEVEEQNFVNSPNTLPYIN